VLNTFSDQLFLSLEKEYSDFLESLELKLERSRFYRSFRSYREIDSLMKKEKIKIVPADKLNEYHYAVYDLTQLMEILEAVKDYPDKKILKDKIEKMNGGSPDPAEENPSNTIARDTQFELKLYADLKNTGLDCELGEPWPDIKIITKKHTYAIECKRIFSDKASRIADRVGDARDQLMRSIDDDKNTIGLIALDITRRLTKGEMYLRAKSSELATARLSKELDDFRKTKEFARHWRPERIGDERISAIVIYTSMYSYLEDEELAAHAAQLVAQNIHGSVYGKMLFKDAVDEVLSPLSHFKTGKLDYVVEN